MVDPQTGILKWWRHGPWFKQHDPDFEPDGTITVFDNGTGAMQSRTLRNGPRDRRVTVEFAGTEEEPNYTSRWGKHQTLPNGNLLLSDAEHGRLLEVSADGEVVWTHDGVGRRQHPIVTEARHVPEDFFTNGLPFCNETIAMSGYALSLSPKWPLG